MDEPRANLRLGITLSRLDSYRHAPRLKPEYIEARYALAKALKSGGCVQDAIAEFQAVIEQCPDHYHAANGLAACYLKQDDNESAAKLLRQVVAALPDFAFARYNFGVALRNLGCAAEAQHQFQAGALLEPSGHSSFHVSGMVRYLDELEQV